MYISAYCWHYEHSRNYAGNEFKNINYRRDGFVLYWSVICLGSSATIRRLFQSGRLNWVEDKDTVLFVYSVSKTRFRHFFFFTMRLIFRLGANPRTHCKPSRKSAAFYDKQIRLNICRLYPRFWRSVRCFPVNWQEAVLFVYISTDIFIYSNTNRISGIFLF